VYVTPRPTRASISLAAQSGMHEGQTTTDETGARDAGKVKRYRERLRALYGAAGLKERREARWLDIGCGFGEFLEALGLESDGHLVTCGSEPNQRKASSARSRGLDVAFRDLANENTTYDFVSLLNVFSHLPHPPELLQQLRTKMRPGGEVVLQTGNWAELERHSIPDRLHLPDHLSFGSEPIVRRVLEAAGFSVTSVLRYPMFRPSLWARLAGRSPATGGACDLWFRARVVD
jgi:SAM-dependent methyltransferase